MSSEMMFLGGQDHFEGAVAGKTGRLWMGEVNKCCRISHHELSVGFDCLLASIDGIKGTVPQGILGSSTEGKK